MKPPQVQVWVWVELYLYLCFVPAWHVTAQPWPAFTNKRKQETGLQPLSSYYYQNNETAVRKFLFFFKLVLIFRMFSVTCSLMGATEILTSHGLCNQLQKTISRWHRNSMSCTVRWVPHSSCVKSVQRMTRTFVLSPVVTCCVRRASHHGR
jgi:hypothetical protein